MTKHVALAIGNGAYEYAPRLKNPVNDAIDIASALEAIGFDVALCTDLSRDTMKMNIRDFCRSIAAAEIALLFYAGHAVQVDGHNYLIPTDANLREKSELATQTISLEVILREMESSQRVSLIFLNACRDNPLTRNLPVLPASNPPSNLGRGLAPVADRIGTLVAFSTQPNNTATDGIGRNSPFTQALLQHLPTPGLDIALVMRRVRKDVFGVTDRRQLPWDHSSLTDSVILVPEAPDHSTRLGTSVPLLSGTLDSNTYDSFEEFVLENVDKVIGLKIGVAPSDGTDELQVSVSNDRLVFYRLTDTRTEINVLGSPVYRHGEYVFDGFYLIKSAGLYQGILSYALMIADEAQVRLSNTPIREIDLDIYLPNEK